MRQNLWCTGLLLLTILMLGSTASAAPGIRPKPEDTLDRMMREGWKPVAPGVLQIHKGDNRVETFAVGPEGMRWALRQVTARLRFLEREYRTYPSNDLQRTIEDLRYQVVRLQEDVESAEERDEALSEVVEKSGCASYSAAADASYQTSVQGVAATASASFNSTCSYPGETYAYAYSRATRGTLVETLTQDDPKTGSAITSSAVTSVQGGADCYSEAYAYARYSPLNIFHSVSDSNSICPAVLSASIGGLPYLHLYGYNYDTVTRSASVTGGVAPYTYKWYRNGSLVGTGSSYTETFYGTNTNWTQTANISLTVTDSNGTTASSTSASYIYYHQQ